MKFKHIKTINIITSAYQLSELYKNKYKNYSLKYSQSRDLEIQALSTKEKRLS